MPANEPTKAEAVAVAVPRRLLKRRRVVTMIVLMIVTSGLYYPIWFLRRRAALNQLDSPRKLRAWPFLILLALAVSQAVLAVATGEARIEETIGVGAALLLTLTQLGVAILMWFQCFFIKEILEDHLGGPTNRRQDPFSPEKVKVSGLLTFFFLIFYLQYVINRHIAALTSIQAEAV